MDACVLAAVPGTARAHQRIQPNCRHASAALLRLLPLRGHNPLPYLTTPHSLISSFPLSSQQFLGCLFAAHPSCVQRPAPRRAQALGGRWDPALDGGMPDEAALARCAARHVREQAGIDISSATRWLRFCE
eukprot:276988-Chlamydomonas_euryale.AAC.1